MNNYTHHTQVAVHTSDSKESSPVEIGRGAQYKVLDLHNGRVRKIPLTEEESKAVVASWSGTSHAPLKPLSNYPQVGVSASKRIQEIIQQRPELCMSLAHPIFEDNGIYTQTKLETMGQFLRRCTSAEAMTLLDAYIETIVEHLRYGFCERVFNFTLNNGVHTNQHVALLDFGEVTFDQEEVATRIATRSWTRSYSCTSELTPELRHYYLEHMSKRLTPETLILHWQRALVPTHLL